MSTSDTEKNNEDSKAVRNNDQSMNIHVGPEINCDSVDTINTKSTFVFFSCNTNNPIILIISNTFSFIFGALLDNICCCITSVSQRVLVTAFLTVIVIGATTGGLVGEALHIIYNCT